MAHKVHVNNSTRISLNDRFTLIQSVGVPGGHAAVSPGPPIMRHPRSRSRSRSRSVGHVQPQSPRMQAVIPQGRSRLARHYEDVMDRQHALARASQQMQSRAPVRNITNKQRLALAMANRGPGSMAALRAVRRPMRRMNGAQAALATMRMTAAATAPMRAGVRGRRMNTAAAAATLRQRQLNRAIATVNQAGLRRRGVAPAAAANRRLSRMDLARSLSKQNLVRERSRSRSRVNLPGPPNRGRSNSRSNLQAARSQSNLRRSNSRLNLNLGNGGGGGGQQARPKINRDFQQRSRSRSRSRQTPSIASRLGVRPGNNNGAPVGRQAIKRSNSVIGRLGKQPVLNRVAQGRVSKQQRLVGKPKNNARAVINGMQGARNGRQMARGRGNNNTNTNQRNVQGGRRQTKPSALQQRLQQKKPVQQKNKPMQQKGGPQRNQQQQQQAKGKGRRGKRGSRPGGVPKRPLKKEDLDHELDKYMSNN